MGLGRGREAVFRGSVLGFQSQVNLASYNLAYTNKVLELQSLTPNALLVDLAGRTCIDPPSKSFKEYQKAHQIFQLNLS